MKQPLVSVVMSCYYHEEYVGKAIESVLNQTYQHFEFLIADDGSPDHSADVISTYKDSRIKFTKYEENTSFKSLEKLFQQAQGEYVAVIASDDMWDKTLLEKYISFLEEHQEYACCVCPPFVIDENDYIVQKSEFYGIFATENQSREQWFRRLYQHGNCICAPSMCIRKSVENQLNGYRFQYRQLQDYEYWLRFLQIGNFYIYPERLVGYRVHSKGENKNISTASDEVNVRDLMERKYMLFDVMENLEEDFFVRVFAGELIYQPDTKEYCLECEKFSVMLASPCVPPHAAIFFWFKHYGEEKFRTHLETYYGVKRKEVWKFTGTDFEKIMENEKNRKRINELCNIVLTLQQKNKEQAQEIERLKAMR